MVTATRSIKNLGNDLGLYLRVNPLQFLGQGATGIATIVGSVWASNNDHERIAALSFGVATFVALHFCGNVLAAKNRYKAVKKQIRLMSLDYAARDESNLPYLQEWAKEHDRFPDLFASCLRAEHWAQYDSGR